MANGNKWRQKRRNAKTQNAVVQVLSDPPGLFNQKVQSKAPLRGAFATTFIVWLKLVL